MVPAGSGRRRLIAWLAVVAMAITAAVVFPRSARMASILPSAWQKTNGRTAPAEKGPGTAPKPAAAKDASPDVVTAEAMMQSLDLVITWQRSVVALEAFQNNPRGILIKSALEQNATRVLRLAFDYARARAATLTLPSADSGLDEATRKRRQDLRNRAAENDRHIEQLNDAWKQAKTQAARAKSKQRAAALNRQEMIAGQIKLAEAQSGLMHTIMSFWTTNDQAQLSGQIDALARTLPELQADSSKAATKPAPPKAADDTQGMIGLIGDMLAISRKENEIAEIVRLTDAIRDRNTEIVGSLKTEFRAMIARGDEIAGAQASDDAAERQQAKGELDQLISRFGMLTKAAAPLAEENMWLDSGERNLADWKASLDRELTGDLRRLLVRLGILGVMILIPLIVGDIARRATERYVKDARRRRSLRIVRRIAISISIALVILLSLVTEFGSLATFAGFLTAGLAVALQNVILSVVAYFFYFSRYGIRVGNRVHINGVYGEVVDIGLVRLHLMELAGSELSSHPTGRIVTFPNSILFQPSAFYKQLSDGDYAWHDISLTFKPETPYDDIKARMQDAVAKVYEDYNEISKPTTALGSFTHAAVETPAPRASLRLTDQGLVYALQYPVESERASEIDYRLSKALLNAIDIEPKLELVAMSFPK